MANDILIIPASSSIQFSGSAANTIYLKTEASGSINFIGNSGSLFTIEDNLSGSLMSVSDISGLPILEVFSDDSVNLGKYNAYAIQIPTGGRDVRLGSGSVMFVTASGFVGIGTNTPTSKLTVVGNISASSVTASNFVGTASWATNALTASSVTGTITSASSATSASFSTSGSYALSASYSLTSSFTTTAAALITTNSYQIQNLTASNISASGTITTNNLNVINSISGASITGSLTGSHAGSLTGTASWATNALTSAFSTTSTSASYLSGSTAIVNNLTVTGILNATQISGSQVYVTSSTLTVTDNIITLNAASPYLRYAGLEMYDTGSGTLANFLWDGQNNYFLLSSSAAGYSRKIVTGPDGEIDLTANYIPLITSSNGLVNSVVYQTGSNIGIGTTTPANKLDIAGNISASNITASLFFGTSSFSNTASYLVPTNNYQVNNLTASNISASNTSSFKIVGINTTTPAYDIDINGTAQVRGNLRVGIGATNPFIYLENNNTTTGYNTITFKDNTTDLAYIQVYGRSGTGTIFGQPNSGSIALYSNNLGAKNVFIYSPYNGRIFLGSGTTSPAITVDTSNNVVIGNKITANSTLDVTGSAIITGSLNVTNGVTGSLLGTSSWANNSVSASYPWIITGSNIAYTTGNIGIGTTIPNSTLSVAGHISASVISSSIINTSFITGSMTWENYTSSGHPIIGVGVQKTGSARFVAINSNIGVVNGGYISRFVENSSEAVPAFGYIKITDDFNIRARNTLYLGNHGADLKYNSGICFQLGDYNAPSQTGSFRFQKYTNTNNSYGADTGFTELMRINDEGKISIGNTSSLELINLGVSSGSYAGISFVSKSNQEFSTIRSYNVFNTASGDLRFYTYNSGTQNERIRIDYNGNVGIGITSPINKLDIAGNISASNITASLFFGTASWSNNSLTASYVSSSNIIGLVTSASYASTSSYSIISNTSNTASYLSGSALINSDNIITFIENANNKKYNVAIYNDDGFIEFKDNTNTRRMLLSQEGILVIGENQMPSVTEPYLLDVYGQGRLYGLIVTGSISASNITASNLLGTASWANNSRTASYITASNIVGTVTSASYALTSAFSSTSTSASYLSGSTAIINNLTVTGVLNATQISGSQIYVTSSTLTVTDNLITLNAASPYLRYAGLEMYDTGSGTLANFLWDGQNNYFLLSSSAAGYSRKIVTGPDSEGDLTSNYVPLSTGSNGLINSIIYQTGSNIGIGLTSSVNKLDVAGNISASNITASLFFGTSSFSNTASYLVPTNNYQVNNLTASNGISASVISASSVNGVSFVFGNSGKISATQFGQLTGTQVGVRDSWTLVSIDGTYPNGVGLSNTSTIWWANSNSVLSTARDLFIGRDDSTTLYLRNTGSFSSPQPGSFRIYNYYTSSGTDFERSNHYWSASNYYIATEQSSSGLARNITFITSGSNRLFISSSGNIGIGTIAPLNKLDVVGNISASNITASLFFGTSSLANTASFVASSSYSLSSSFTTLSVSSSYLIPTNNYQITNLTASNISASGFITASSILTSGSITTLNALFAPTISSSLITASVIASSQSLVFRNTTTPMVIPASGAMVAFSHSLSQSATLGAQIYGVTLAQTFNNTTASQTQTAFRVMPTFTGSFTGSNTSNIIADFGATSVGTQFSINDVTSGSIYMVNDVSGLPILEAQSDWTVNMYQYPNVVFKKSGSYLTLGTTAATSSVTVKSDLIIDESLGFTYRQSQVSGSTNGAVTSSIYNLLFTSTSSSVFLNAIVTGYDTGSRDTITGDIKATIRYRSGAASVIGFNQKFVNSDTGSVDFDILASSTSASLVVYGVTGRPYQWGATVTAQVI